MRILTIVHDLGPGGTQRVAQNYAIGYQEAGHDSAVLAFRGSGPRAAQLSAAGILLFAGSDARSVDAAVKDAAGWRPDILHVHRAGSADAESARIVRAMNASVGSRVPAIETNVFARYDYSEDRHLIDVHMLLTRWCFWKWSRWSRGSHPQPLGVVVPNATDVDSFYPASEAQVAAFRDRYGIPSDAIVFGRVGQPHMPKWSRALVDAFAALQSETAYLLLVGAPKEIEDIVEGLDASTRSRVLSIGFLPSDAALRSAYSAMDVFVLASMIGESFGMVLAESMLCGTPVVALSTPTRDNSQIEVVGHGEGGLIATDVQSMTQAMRQLMEDPELRAELAERGRARVLREYSVARACDLLLRTASAVLESDSREDLAQRLSADPELTSHVSDAEIKKLLDDTVGRTSIRDRVMMSVVHQPQIYKLYHTAKHRQR